MASNAEVLRRELLRSRLKKSAARHNRHDTLEPIEAADRSGPLPLSFAQQRLWFITQLDPRASTTYHLTGGVRLTGQLDRVALRAALDRIVARHEVLRTRFEQAEGVAVQVIAPTGSFALQELATAEERLQALIAAEAHAPFDLVSGPLIRGQLLCLADSEHVLLVSMHHIVSDGWSLGIFMRELGALYSALRQGYPDPLAPLSLQYADYAYWQRQWVSGERLQSQLHYWKQQLAGAPPVLELPADRARPAVESYAGAWAEVCLEAPLARQLRELSRAHGVTLYMTLLGSWAVLLSRLSGQKDVVIGTPVANRNRAELEELIGFFVNTLALRIDLSAEPSVSDLLEQVKGVVLQAHAQQDIPFEQVVDAVSPVRTLAHGPLFQVMFAWQNTPAGELELPGLRLQGLALPAATANFDLTLALQESGAEIRGALEYATTLFDGETVERYLGYWQRLLQGMVARGTQRDVRQRVDQLEMLDEPERRRLLTDWNSTAMQYARECCLQELFEAQVERDPEATAVVHQGQRVSYRELNAQANRLAHHLRALGVRPDTRVGICAERSLELVVGVLAIVKAGGAYVPLDPAYPLERLGYMIGDSAPAAVLTSSAVRPVLEAAAVTVRLIDLQADAGAWAGQSTENPDPREAGLGSRHLAYVIYTSGSTGRPKGVMIEHRSAVNHMLWQCREYGFCAADRVLQHTSLSFDTAVSELWSCWTAGACLVLPVDEVVKDPAALLKLIDQEGVTIADFVPSLLQSLLSQPEKPERALRYLFCGGEPLTAELVSRARAGWAEAVVNLYGPTEATIEATAWICGETQAGHSIPIGRPIANTRVYILDEHQEPVPRGVIGEIYIAGEGLARGYLNQPELTQQRFVRDPFVDAPAEADEARMYRTGDVGRWLPGGVLEFLGRNDQQVKVRGYRIELGEIEARLREHPGVREGVVIAREDSPGDKRLVAYLIPNDESVTVESLRVLARAVLPEHMVPSAFVLLSLLPLTPSGKLDRRALPAPEADAYGRRKYEAPQGELETALAQIWRGLLKIEQVGRDDSFFELGGHSLLAVTACQKMAQAIGREVPLAKLFMAPTLAQFARSLQDSGSPAEARHRLRFRADQSARHAIYFLPTVFGMGSYFAGWAPRLSGQLDVFSCNLPLATDAAQQVSLPTIRDIAAYCRAQMLEERVPGSFSLVGWSFGGVVAHELARQLSVEGVPPRTLVLIDSYLVSSDLASIETFPLEELRKMFDAELSAARTIGNPDPASFQEESALQAVFQRYRSNVEALFRHEALACDVRTIEIRAAESEALLREPRTGPRALPLQRSELIILPGDHYSIVGPGSLETVVKLIDRAAAG